MHLSLHGDAIHDAHTPPYHRRATTAGSPPGPLLIGRARSRDPTVTAEGRGGGGFTRLLRARWLPGRSPRRSLAEGTRGPASHGTRRLLVEVEPERPRIGWRDGVGGAGGAGSRAAVEEAGERARPRRTAGEAMVAGRVVALSLRRPWASPSSPLPSRSCSVPGGAGGGGEQDPGPEPDALIAPLPVCCGPLPPPGSVRCAPPAQPGPPQHREPSVCVGGSGGGGTEGVFSRGVCPQELLSRR